MTRKAQISVYNLLIIPRRLCNQGCICIYSVSAFWNHRSYFSDWADAPMFPVHFIHQCIIFCVWCMSWINQIVFVQPVFTNHSLSHRAHLSPCSSARCLKTLLLCVCPLPLHTGLFCILTHHSCNITSVRFNKVNHCDTKCFQEKCLNGEIWEFF